MVNLVKESGLKKLMEYDFTFTRVIKCQWNVRPTYHFIVKNKSGQLI